MADGFSETDPSCSSRIPLPDAAAAADVTIPAFRIPRRVHLGMIFPNLLSMLACKDRSRTYSNLQLTRLQCINPSLDVTIQTARPLDTRRARVFPRAQKWIRKNACPRSGLFRIERCKAANERCSS